jgi:F0F1-type ATP synthase assembly protein I
VELRDRQATWNGFGEALSLAVGLVLTPLLFALFGWWLDRMLGTGPVLAIGFGLLGLFGQCAHMYYSYKVRMEKEEEGKPWKRSPQ